MVKYYAGVGSRQTPPKILGIMTQTARHLASRGWTLRSGHAPGADQAFEKGAGDKAMIYLPWSGFGTRPYKGDPGCPIHAPFVIGDEDSLIWAYNELVRFGVRSRDQENVQRPVKLLHGRNLLQVIGHESPIVPVRFVLCWCQEINGEPQGGTGTAVKLARHCHIRVINLWKEKDLQFVLHKLKEDQP